MTLTPEQIKEIENDASVSVDDLSIAQLHTAVRHRAALLADNKELRKEYSRLNESICQILGKALGYPWYMDDQVNFPGATEVNGVCVGDHVAESIASEAAKALSAAKAQGVDREKALAEHLFNGGTLSASGARHVAKVVFHWLHETPREDAITPTQPSPDRLTEDERDRIDTARYHADKHQDEWWSEAIFNLANIIDRLTTPQAPSVPTRENYHHASEQEAELLNKWLRFDLSQEQCDTMEALFRKVGLVYWDDPMRPKLFTPSPSPEQRGETP